MATLSGFSCRYASPRILPPPPRLRSGSIRWLYRIFSAKDSGRSRICRTRANLSRSSWYGGVIELQSFSGSDVWVAKYREWKGRHVGTLRSTPERRLMVGRS